MLWRDKLINLLQSEYFVKTRLQVVVCAIAIGMSSCATRPASVPDTSILSEIQATLTVAENTTGRQLEETTENDTDLLDELIPSLSLDENLLTPVEEPYPFPHRICRQISSSTVW